MKRLIQLKKTTHVSVAALLLACFGLAPAPKAFGVVPAPDGGYPGGNTAEGQAALLSLTTGGFNTAVGFFSLRSDTTGMFNTGIGAGTLLGNTGDRNTATGAGTMLSNSTGHDNTANGAFALLNDTTGDQNTALGAGALFHNTEGTDNTAIGHNAFFANTTGGANTAVGKNALAQNISGNFNTAIGKDAGELATGSGNVYIGHLVVGVLGEDNHTYIRNINSTSVNGAGTDTVTIDLTTGLLGHLSSSRRYKEDIKPMNNASETLYRLKPATYRYKKEIDPAEAPAFGLIAEEVAEVNPDLVACNSQGDPESVHYEMVNAMLLNEFLKEHREVQELKKQVAALTAGLQKVSAQFEMNRTAPQIVVNNH